MKELDTDKSSTTAAKTATSKIGSDEDSVLVESGGPAVNDKGSIRKKKGKK